MTSEYEVRGIKISYKIISKYSTLSTTESLDESPWLWRQQAPPKHQWTTTTQHSATSQQAAIFMLAVVVSWNVKNL
jgi:hypothetical protein